MKKAAAVLLWLIGLGLMIALIVLASALTNWVMGLLVFGGFLSGMLVSIALFELSA